MLNIPAEVKTLFKSDSVFKNFHVNFPNGEHTDLNNDDVISESVSFTESICSKDVFQFGLSERPQIEFECVNVPNIYGVTIYCAIEICVDSLGAQWISDHQPAGTEKWLDPQVCTYGVRNMYRIPYGSFIVQSCPRSHGAMYRRRVTAYGRTAVNLKLSSFLMMKYATNGAFPEIISQNPFAIIADSLNDISWLPTTETTITYSSSQITYSMTLYIDQTYALQLSYNYYNMVDSRRDPYRLYRLTCNTNDSLYHEIIADLEERGININYYSSDFSNYSVLKELQAAFYPNVEYRNSVSTNNPRVMLEPNDSGYIYAYMPKLPNDTVVDNTFFSYSTEVTSAKLLLRQGLTLVHDYGTAQTNSNVELKRYTINTNDLLRASIAIKGTSVHEMTGYTIYSYVNAVNFPNLLDGVFELFGWFQITGRDGNQKTVSLNKNNPYAITPDQYSELWFDDFEVDHIGTVIFSYYDSDAGKAQTEQYDFDYGESVYDMTSNYLLSNLNVTSDSLGESVRDYVYRLIDTYFIPQTEPINYLPFDMTALNIPYFEPGDYLEIDDGNGGTVGSYLLTRSISGIQTLYDSIEASGGKLDGEG